MKKTTRSISSVIAAFALAGAIASVNAVTATAADTTEDTQIIVTQYADLWKSEEITAQAGKPVKWYVEVPDDVTPKGCGATIKIPDLGFGTDTHNKEEGHIVLQQGENFIYEFTPEETGDILFTCWMGSGCHKNYIHITEPEPSPEDEQEPEIEVQTTADAASDNDTEDTTVISEEETEQDNTVSDTDNDDQEATVEETDTDEDEDTETEAAPISTNSTDTAAAQTSSNPKTDSSAGGILAAMILAASALTLSKKTRR